MRNYIFTILLLLSGCNGIDRLTSGKDDVPTTRNISSRPIVGIPEFGIDIPAGYKRIIYHGQIQNDGIIDIGIGEYFDVMVVQVYVGQWFRIGRNYSSAFYYTYDSVNKTIKIHGDHIENMDYLIYEYIKGE